MSDDCRLFYRPGVGQPPLADGAPTGNTRESIVARNALGDYLDAVLIRPLHFTEEQQMGRVTEALNTMTRSERILIEIEMTERAKKMHSFDYDPLR